MPEVLSYATNPPHPLAAWCLRCGAKYAVVPPELRCPACSGSIATAGQHERNLAGTIARVLTLVELTIVAPALFLISGPFPPLAFFGFAWIFVIFWIIPAFHVYLIMRALWNARTGSVGIPTLTAFIVALPLTGIAVIPQLARLSSHHNNLTAILCAGFAGVAIVQLGLCPILHSRGLRMMTIACAILAAAQFIASPVILFYSGLPKRWAMWLIVVPLAAQILLLYAARYRVRRGT